MSSRSGGGNKKRFYNGGPSFESGSGKERSQDQRPNDENGIVSPLESRLIEVRDSNGCIVQVPALDKRWVPSINFVEFYLPSCQALLDDDTALLTWLDHMEIYCKDLKWLLSIPHHRFWSVIVHTPNVSNLLLNSFLLRAPQWFDKEFRIYLEHEIMGPKYQQVYSLVFRVFMRLCTFKESKKDFITPITWASILVDHEIIDVVKIQSLCCIFDSEHNIVLPRMIDNVIKSSPKLMAAFRDFIPRLLQTSADMTVDLRNRIRQASATNVWNLNIFDELLQFFINTTSGLYKLCKVYTPIAEILFKYPNALLQLAVKYESNCCNLWGSVTAHLPNLEERVKMLRILIIRLFRVALANPTIKQVSSSNDQRIDEYFEMLTNLLDEKLFILDYEKAYPFRQDINALLSKGVFIDETRIDYIANAISACFNACGEDYAVEKIVVDPLYDPNFDRQLLGACSLDVTGVELQSLVTQVKDILPELPDSYVEAVLKHYGYQAEVSINALLEGSVPTRLEKYKKESYVKPLTNGSDQQVPTAADTELEKLTSKLVIKDGGAEAERFFPGKRRHGFDDTGRDTTIKKENDASAWLQPKTKELVTKMQEESASMIPTSDNNPSKVKKSTRMQSFAVEEERERYIDESLLPSVRDSYEYEDEYDDTYDEFAVGMTEPDNIECKPLNQKKTQAAQDADDEDDDEEEKDKRKLDFCEDPAIVRARLERRREEKSQQHNHRRGGGGPPPSNDVVGKAKGQGQEKDVLYARRQKNINKDSGGFKKKRADFKRREF